MNSAAPSLLHFSCGESLNDVFDLRVVDAGDRCVQSAQFFRYLAHHYADGGLVGRVDGLAGGAELAGEALDAEGGVGVAGGGDEGEAGAGLDQGLGGRPTEVGFGAEEEDALSASLSGPDLVARASESPARWP